VEDLPMLLQVGLDNLDEGGEGAAAYVDVTEFVVCQAVRQGQVTLKDYKKCNNWCLI